MSVLLFYYYFFTLFGKMGNFFFSLKFFFFFFRFFFRFLTEKSIYEILQIPYSEVIVAATTCSGNDYVRILYLEYFIDRSFCQKSPKKNFLVFIVLVELFPLFRELGQVCGFLKILFFFFCFFFSFFFIKTNFEILQIPLF